MSRLSKVLLLAVGLALVATPALAEKVYIGVASPFTGDLASYGDNIKAGVEMKVEEVNAMGGVNGKMVEAVWFDEQCSPKEAATVATKIAMDTRIPGIVGHLCSSAHLAALPTYVRKGVSAISPTATNVTIAEKSKDRKGNVWGFRNVYTDGFQGKFLAKYVKNVLGLKRIGVFYENNDYGIGLKDSFVGEAKRIGLSVVGEEAYVKGAQDFTPQLTKLKGGKPDGLFISGYYTEGGLIAGQAQKLGMDVVKIGADGLDNSDYIKLGGAAANNSFMSVPFLVEAGSDEAKAFVAKFEKRYERDIDWMSANAYDAAGQLLQAIGAVGNDRAKVREYLANMNSRETGYKGVTGITFFDENGDCVKAAFMKMVKNGKFQAAKQME